MPIFLIGRFTATAHIQANSVPSLSIETRTFLSTFSLLLGLGTYLMNGPISYHSSSSSDDFSQLQKLAKFFLLLHWYHITIPTARSFSSSHRAYSLRMAQNLPA